LSEICSKLVFNFLSDFSRKFSKFLIKLISESLFFSIILLNLEFIFSLIFQLKVQNSLKTSFKKVRLEFLFSKISLFINSELFSLFFIKNILIIIIKTKIIIIDKSKIII
jgi:hypothetical protein